MRVTVVGAGHVGLVAGVCMAEIGHDVVCVDNNAERLALLEQGKSWFYEPYLEELMQRCGAAGRLKYSTDLGEATRHAQAIFLCVGTPPLPGGEADLSAVEWVTRRIAESADGYKLVVEKSTVPVLTGERIARTLRIYSQGGGAGEFEVASNPEFLAEGTAVIDFLFPDRIVVGVESERAEQILREIYEPVVNRSFDWRPSGRQTPDNARKLLVTDRNSAEIIKHASNSFLATRISYINMVARLCDAVGADVERVAEGMGLDHRIGPHFLRPGIGFGGFCFPKDLQSFVRMAEKSGCDFSLLKEVERINLGQVDDFLRKLHDAMWVIRGKRLAVWGLAFKANTDDLRFSPAISVVERLVAEGAEVVAYDPQSMDAAREELTGVSYAASALAAAENADAVLILTDWREFRDLDRKALRQAMARPLILDGRNLLDPAEVRADGFEYVAVGRP